MATISKIQNWADAHHPMWIDFLRIALGIILIGKSIYFLINREELMAGTAFIEHPFPVIALSHYIIMVHLVGGILIAIGLLTRAAVIFNLPVLLAAVFFVNLARGIFYGEFWLSLVTLVLLIIFLVYGSGKFSVSHYMRTHKES